MIENDKVNAEFAADTVANNTVAMFESMDNVISVRELLMLRMLRSV